MFQTFTTEQFSVTKTTNRAVFHKILFLTGITEMFIFWNTLYRNYQFNTSGNIISYVSVPSSHSVAAVTSKSSPVLLKNREVSSGKWTGVSLNVCVSSVSGQDGISESALDLKLYWVHAMNWEPCQIWPALKFEGGNVSYSVTAAPSTSYKLGIPFFFNIPLKVRLLTLNCVCFPECRKPKQTEHYPILIESFHYNNNLLH